MQVVCPRDTNPSLDLASAVPSIWDHLLGIAITIIALGFLDIVILKGLARRWFGSSGGGGGGRGGGRTTGSGSERTEQHTKTSRTAAAAAATFEANEKEDDAKADDARTKARWFFIHSIANLVIVATGLEDCFVCLQHPSCCMVEPMRSYIPSYLAFGVHLYHFLGFSDLRMADVVHHLLFPLPMGIVDFTLHWGPLVNFLLFFMSGLPGGIDYLMLCGVKLGKFQKLEEKRINAHINIWLRGPGLVIVSAVMWTCVLSRQTGDVHPMLVLVFMILTFGNGVYYGQQVVRNYEEERCLIVSRKMIQKELMSPTTY